VSSSAASRKIKSNKSLVSSIVFGRGDVIEFIKSSLQFDAGYGAKQRNKATPEVFMGDLFAARSCPSNKFRIHTLNPTSVTIGAGGNVTAPLFNKGRRNNDRRITSDGDDMSSSCDKKPRWEGTGEIRS
jgi:hypothetical protein